MLIEKEVLENSNLKLILKFDDNLEEEQFLSEMEEDHEGKLQEIEALLNEYFSLRILSLEEMELLEDMSEVEIFTHFPMYDNLDSREFKKRNWNNNSWVFTDSMLEDWREQLVDTRQLTLIARRNL